MLLSRIISEKNRRKKWTARVAFASGGKDYTASMDILENGMVTRYQQREMKYDTNTGNWTVHTSFNDVNRSYEIALLFKDNKIIFVKEFV